MFLNNYFAVFLQGVQPSDYSRRTAARLHRVMREHLADSADPVFKKWYGRSGTSFLYGSYARNTAIQPIKDVDVCIELELDPNQVTPKQVLEKLRQVLEKNYDGKTAPQRRSIRVDLSSTTLDAVPVVPTGNAQDPYWIPDRELKQWIHTHPKAHISVAREKNAEADGGYIPLVKIVKHWYRYQAKTLREKVRPKPKGFTLEVLVAKFHNPKATNYAEAFTTFLENLYSNFSPSLREGIFPTLMDPGLPWQPLKVTFTRNDCLLFDEIISESLSKAKNAIKATTVGESATLWREIFGSKFPEAPEEEIASKKSIEAGKSQLLNSSFFARSLREIDLYTPETTLDNVILKAEIIDENDGKVLSEYRSNEKALAKGVLVKFAIVTTSVEEPYEIRWTVNNTGDEAEAAEDLGHWTITESDQKFRCRHTAYSGMHTMQCEIMKNGKVVASTEHRVWVE